MTLVTTELCSVVQELLYILFFDLEVNFIILCLEGNFDMREEPLNLSEMMQDPNLQGDICRDFLRNVF
jgi:hypothetical protein